MEARQVRPTDAPLVLSLALDDRSHLVSGHEWPSSASGPQTLARAAIPLALRGRSWIARDGDSVAFLEAQPRQYVIGWDVVRLAARGDLGSVLGPVVQQATAHLQSRGVPRLFARCRDEVQSILRAVGFQALAREYVLLSPIHLTHDDHPLPSDSRYRMPSDAWPLHQLELECTPMVLRQLAGLTSIDWAHGTRNMSEIVIERDGKIVAWVGWSDRVRHGLRRLGMLVHPEHRDLAPAVLQQALKSMPRDARLFTRVREYHEHLLLTFEDAGFQTVLEETLMVKHAGVELSPVIKTRMRVAGVPSIQALPITLGGLGSVHRDQLLQTRVRMNERDCVAPRLR